MPERETDLVEVPCNLCQGSEVRIKFRSPPSRYTPQDPIHFQAATDVYGDFGRIVQCRACHLVYTNPRLGSSEVLRQYADVEDEEYASEDSSRSINAHFSLNTIRKFAPGGRLLDIGSAAGYFLNAARLHFSAEGVEPARQAAEFSRTRLKLPVFSGGLEDAKIPSDRFDVICLSDVIEHLPDPFATLREAARISRPGGLLYIVTPNIASFTARLLGSKWWGLRPAHLYYFSPSTLRAMLDKAGYDVVLMRSYGRVFRMAYWLSRLRNYSPMLNRLLRWGIRSFGIEHKLVYLNTMDSIECCARRRSA